MGHEENASSSNMTSHSNGSESVANTSTHNENTTANATAIINHTFGLSVMVLLKNVQIPPVAPSRPNIILK